MTAHATRPAEGKRASALEAVGLVPQRPVYWNLGPPALYEHAARRGEGLIVQGGAFCAVTSPHTGRSPGDKFIVREPASADDIAWGRVNQPLDPEHFERLKTVVLVHFGQRTILIGGTRYAGELKKAVFSILNYLLPKTGVLPMHCSANLGETGDVALFFGLSGTGKTTLSADPQRALIGDDEHGWSDHGVFNFEGGCYAKVIH